MDRTYLFVPPEDRALVEGLGARWDSDSKRWYVDSNSPEDFSRWLDQEAETDEDLDITSSEAFVAIATVACRNCGAHIEVICIHCASGNVSDVPLTSFTLSDLWAMDENLAAQLRPWPLYRKTTSGPGKSDRYLNHCAHCGAAQDDLYLHCEPGDVFFSIPQAVAEGSVRLLPLVGTVGMAGDEHFEV